MLVYVYKYSLKAELWCKTFSQKKNPQDDLQSQLTNLNINPACTGRTFAIIKQKVHFFLFFSNLFRPKASHVETFACGDGGVFLKKILYFFAADSLKSTVRFFCFFVFRPTSVYAGIVLLVRVMEAAVISAFKFLILNSLCSEIGHV